MDEVDRRLAATTWTFAEQDHGALLELTRRLIDAARRRDLITYSDLVLGVTFYLSTVNDGQPFQIDPSSWSEIDRAILGDFLGCIAAHSYADHRFLASAVAVSKEDRCPTEPFFKWAHTLGLLTDNTVDGRLVFWTNQVNHAYEVYAVAPSNLTRRSSGPPSAAADRQSVSRTTIEDCGVPGCVPLEKGV